MATTKHLDTFVEKLLFEIESQKTYLLNEPVSTIYFGGGTPSLLNTNTVQIIIEKIKQHFNVQPNVEITLEANPDDLKMNYLVALKETEVNRLSLGVQSFHDADLHYLNRVHAAEQAEKSILLAQNAGFTNLTIDLIYGIPTLTNEKWLDNLKLFFELKIPHLSAYALTVEPKTALNTLINRGKMQPVDEQQTAEQFELLVKQMDAQGFVHYEISNFALPGHYSRHNSIYWTGGNYLGLGPSAHSYNGITRQWNVSNLNQYIHENDFSNIVEDKEALSLEQRYNEYVMTSLRTIWGCDIEHVYNTFGKKVADHCHKQANKYIERDQLELKQNRYYLRPKGKFFADGIAADLFL